MAHIGSLGCSLTVCHASLGTSGSDMFWPDFRKIKKHFLSYITLAFALGGVFLEILLQSQVRIALKRLARMRIWMTYDDLLNLVTQIHILVDACIGNNRKTKRNRTFIGQPILKTHTIHHFNWMFIWIFFTPPVEFFSSWRDPVASKFSISGVLRLMLEASFLQQWTGNWKITFRNPACISCFKKRWSEFPGF